MVLEYPPVFHKKPMVLEYPPVFHKKPMVLEYPTVYHKKPMVLEYPPVFHKKPMVLEYPPVFHKKTHGITGKYARVSVHHPGPDPESAASVGTVAARCPWSADRTCPPGSPSRPRSVCSAPPPESSPPPSLLSSDATRAPRSSDRYDGRDPELVSP